MHSDLRRRIGGLEKERDKALEELNYKRDRIEELEDENYRLTGAMCSTVGNDVARQILDNAAKRKAPTSGPAVESAPRDGAAA